MEKSKLFVVVCDIKGYSQLDDAELVRFHREILPDLSKRLKIDTFEHIDTWGDALLVACANPVDAVEAALEIRDFFRGFPWSERNFKRLAARVSAHRGEVYVGEDPFTRRGGIVGQSIIHAARIEPVTKPNQVWATADMVQACRGMLDHHDPSFSADLIGAIPLAKSYGASEIFTLRRAHEAALEASDRDEILQAAKERLDLQRKTMGLRDTFSVVCAVVTSKGRVALVRRRDKGEGFDWMFPSGVVLPLQDPGQQAQREMLEETGLSCVAMDKISERDHPQSKLFVEYFALRPLDPDARVENRDTVENEDASWVEIPNALDLLGGNIDPEVRAYLQAAAGET